MKVIMKSKKELTFGCKDPEKFIGSLTKGTVFDDGRVKHKLSTENVNKVEYIDADGKKVVKTIK